MKFSTLFKRPVKGGITKTIRGIKAEDWINVYATITREYKDTALKHKKPTEYMRGLAFAIKVLESVKPYEIPVEVN